MMLTLFAQIQELWSAAMFHIKIKQFSQFVMHWVYKFTAHLHLEMFVGKGSGNHSPFVHVLVDQIEPPFII